MLGGRSELRLPPAETLHLTLVFLGHRPAGDLATIEDAALEAVADLPRARLRAGEVVPVPRGRPRLLALDLLDPAGEAAEIASAVGRALEPAGLHQPERQAFWPHMTLARIRSAGRRAGRSAGDLGLRTGLGLAEDEDLVFDRVAIYRSQLSPAGARYEALAHVELGT